MAEKTVGRKNRFNPKNIVLGIARFFREFKSEIKKISWPTKNTVVKNTLIVLAVCAIAGVVVWVSDAALRLLMRELIGVDMA